MKEIRFDRANMMRNDILEFSGKCLAILGVLEGIATKRKLGSD